MTLTDPKADSVVFYAPGDVRIEPIREVPVPKKGEALIKVEACAICGTDLKSFGFGNPRIKPPQVMGHEFCGTIIEVGEGVADYRVGQRVVMATTMGCGDCPYCRRGWSNLCVSPEAIGFHYPGAMGPYVIIPEKGVRLRHLVDVGDLEAVVASLAEPISCVINNLSHVPTGEIRSALILGLGPLGLLHAICLAHQNAEKIVCVDFPGKRADLARELGMIVCSPEEIDQQYLSLTNGCGFDLVAITAPDAVLQGKAPIYARKRGYVSYFASLPTGNEMLAINSRTLHYNELVLYGTSDSTPQHVAAGVSILRERESDIRKLITHILPMGDFHEGITTLKTGNAIKVVLIP